MRHGYQPLATWKAHGTVFSGETSTTVGNTTRNIFYGDVCIVAAGMNVLGHPPYFPGAPYAAVLCKGDDQVFFCPISMVEKLEDGIYSVYRRTDRETKPNGLDQFTDGVSRDWGFLSTSAKIIEDQCMYVTRDLTRYLRFAPSVVSSFNPNLVSKYGLHNLIGARLITDANIMLGVSGGFGPYGAIAKSMHNRGKSIVDEGFNYPEILPLIQTKDDYYTELLNNPKIAQEIDLLPEDLTLEQVKLMRLYL